MENLPTSQNSLGNPQITGTDRPPSLSRKSHELIIFSTLFLIVMVIIGVFVYLFKGTRFFSTTLELEKTQSEQLASKKEDNSAQVLKVAFLKSKNLSTVTVGAALVFVPVTEMKLDYGSPQYNLWFYGLELTEEQHKKFVGHAYPYGEFPGSIPTINDSPVWLAAAPSDTEMILTKKGYVCLTPIDYGSTICADNGSGSCITPGFKGLKCTYVKKSERK